MPRGRLAPNTFGLKTSEQTEPCQVSAQLSEDGTLTLAVTASGAYIEGGLVAAHIEQDEIPADLVAKVKAALWAVLQEAHDDLKDEFTRARHEALARHAHWTSTEQRIAGGKVTS
jgi:hypothetical protein